MQNEFQRTLSRLLVESGKSTTAVAKFGGVDRAYLIRLLEGTKSAFHNPSLGGRWLKQMRAQPRVRNA
jgi:predicted transcriptional regulator